MKSFLPTLVRPWIPMAMLALRILAAEPGIQGTPLEGMWRWSFTNADGGSVRPTLQVTRNDDGTLGGVSRFRPGTATPVTNLTFNGNRVAFDVVRLRDGESILTRYQGTLNGDSIAGTIVTGAPGEERNHAWNAVRFGDIEGVWKWSTNGSSGSIRTAPGRARRPGGVRGGNPGARGENSLILQRGDGEKLSGKVRLGRGEQEALHLKYRQGELSFQTARVRSDGSTSTNYYWGKIARETLHGEFTTDVGGVHRTNEWHATRVE